MNSSQSPAASAVTFSLPAFQRRAAAFTLIELLVVITIIAILAGLAFPAVNGAINSARKAQARNDVIQIAAAVKAYQAEYGRMPHTQTSSDTWISDNRQIMEILTVPNPNSPHALNPKGIKFLEPKSSTRAKGGFFDGVFYDPWGVPYALELDTDYNGRINNAYFGRNNFGTVSVICIGADGSEKNRGQDATDITNF
ncbi:MAG: prepilin-type N-terminal cleavage/methylation domain-containing protein [Verrucomicrobia bacterium]|nr:prepilin-type N-terminal cleavage/methylation domain-containing protein [Verrucomicrobiota bacterium]